MTGIIAVTLICAAMMFYVYSSELSNASTLNKNITKKTPIMICTVAFIIRVILSMLYHGHSTDINCFDGWASIIYNEGIPGFYVSEGFHDYPPGYMYILYIIGAIKAWLSPSENVTWLLLKLPAIICDIITGILIYKISFIKDKKTRFSSLILTLYVLNPAVILNSSLWGQVDSVYTLFVILMLYMLSEKKLIISYFIFAICIFIKPQAFMFFPLVIYGIIENVFLVKFDIKVFLKNLFFGLLAIGMLFLLSLPFGIENVINQYTATLGSYSYLTVNAFNIWGALGMNWSPLTVVTTFIGFVFIAFIVAYTTYVFFKSRQTSKYYIVGAVLSFFTFMLSTKMHDRYAFPAMALLLAAFAASNNKKNYLLYVLITISQFFNTAWVLFVYEIDINKHYNSPVINIASIVNIAIMIFFVYCISKEHSNADFECAKEQIKQNKKDYSYIDIETTTTHSKFTKFDYIFVVAIMLIYSCIAFYNLGDTKAPQTELNIANEPCIIDIGKETEISKLSIYLGSYNIDETRSLSIDYLDSNENVVSSQTETSGAVFCWNDYIIPEESAKKPIRYIKLSSQTQTLTIKELAIKSSDGKIIDPTNAETSGASALFDEQNLVPDRTTNLNSTYFDEIYHARTAYEFIHHLDVYEWTHPPLGKALMAIGIKLFGMTPFGWRFIGTLFGILMIPIIYLFAKRLSKSFLFSAIPCIIFTFDFMHFVQTRIATIDVYVTFFIMLMYLFMYKYYTTSFYDTPLRKTFVPLGLCGISMGLGISSKWTGAYAGVGLAVIFFITMYKRYREYLYAKSIPDGTTNGISHRYIIDSFSNDFKRTILFCIAFFVVIPIVIYLVSYIPYLQSPGNDGIGAILKNQKDMYLYHSDTVVSSTHPFSSRWYEWIIMKRPIFYYSGTVSENVREGISAFGNPAVWWVGIIAFFYMIYNAIIHKDKTALFIIIGYLAQLVSWIPITRTTYIYHYFPSVPFVTLMIGYSISLIYNRSTKKKSMLIYITIYTTIAVGLFVLFYPVLSGAPCDTDFAQTWLKWFDSWVLL